MLSGTREISCIVTIYTFGQRSKGAAAYMSFVLKALSLTKNTLKKSHDCKVDLAKIFLQQNTRHTVHTNQYEKQKL